MDQAALERSLKELRANSDALKFTEETLKNEQLKPDAPWGLAVYRTCYDDEAKWQKMLEHLETEVPESDEDNSRIDALLKRHRFVIIDNKTQFDGASLTMVRDHFEQWSKEELERNWAQQPVTDEMRIHMYEGPSGSGTRYNVFIVIDDICLMSFDRLSM